MLHPNTSRRVRLLSPRRCFRKKKSRLRRLRRLVYCSSSSLPLSVFLFVCSPLLTHTPAPLQRGLLLVRSLLCRNPQSLYPCALIEFFFFSYRLILYCYYWVSALCYIMKLYGLLILKPHPQGVEKDPVICCSAVDVSSFGFFQRNSAREFIVFLSRTVAKRVTLGAKTQITENGNVVYAHATLDGIVAIAVSDIEYSARVAFTLLTELVLQFQQTFRGKYESVTEKPDEFLRWPHINETLEKYQKPEEVDKLLRIKRDIEDTKVIMYNAIDQIIERGQKIDDLVAQSEDLGMASKTFYTQAKQTNAGCCAVM
ncbi:vesicle-associated membrane protein, putative [Leishmania tarentolae]|uniref:Vesicle-associated membrane protein, putative n=1 Tax=Leishmania tarentolae TaxID=5689 RepID=A0A640KUM7_LEITA|nr:vesicle-associated membrane protein, putative [Leishmania tarentolae]